VVKKRLRNNLRRLRRLRFKQKNPKRRSKKRNLHLRSLQMISLNRRRSLSRCNPRKFLSQL